MSCHVLTANLVELKISYKYRGRANVKCLESVRDRTKGKRESITKAIKRGSGPPFSHGVVVVVVASYSSFYDASMKSGDLRDRKYA